MGAVADILTNSLPRKRSKDLKADRATLALAGVALATAGVVLGSEALKLARRRRESKQVDTPESPIAAAGLATRDTVDRARRGLRGGAPARDHPLQHADRLHRRLRADAARHLGPEGRLVADRPDPARAAATSTTSCPGILLAFGAGGAGLATSNDRLEELLSFAFGAGVGLTFDEAALLLDLRDVYWTREGVVSLQVSFGLTAVLAATLLGLRMLRRGEEQGIEEGLIPGLEADTEAQATVGSLR